MELNPEEIWKAAVKMSSATAGKGWLLLPMTSFLSDISIRHTLFSSNGDVKARCHSHVVVFCMKISVSLFPAMTAWMGSSEGFEVVSTKVSDVQTN